MQGSQAVRLGAHNPGTVGSTPTPATKLDTRDRFTIFLGMQSGLSEETCTRALFDFKYEQGWLPPRRTVLHGRRPGIWDGPWLFLR